MRTRHVERRVRTSPTTVAVGTLCGAASTTSGRDRDLFGPDARDLLRLAKKNEPKFMGKTWEICPACRAKL